MRSRICKAKRKDNKEWVEGYYFCMVHDDKRHEHHFIIPIGADLSKGTPIEQIQVEIDIETLCDDTGLTDKNGRKIWENDIVEAWSAGIYAKGKITHRIDGCWIMYPAWQNGEMWYLLPNKKGITTVEVIGNAFENQELLSATENIGYADQSGLMSAT